MALFEGVVRPEEVQGRVARQLEGGANADVAGKLFVGMTFGALAFSLLVVAILVITVLIDAWPVLSDRIGDFLGAGSRTSADETGVFQGLRGTFWIGVTVVVLAFPIGISAAIYLEEYASKNRFARFVDVNIRNLAGVPSVVYGILGFTVFVKLLDGFFPNSADAHAGKTTLAAGLTLAVLVLPIVIITSAEAIRAVPQPLREAGYGVGATKWEVIRHHVLPYAAPGILTGTLLSLARALGEAAPILLVGAVEGRLGSQAGFFDVGQLGEQFTAMPALITTFAGKPGVDWVQVTAAAIVVLLVVVMVANAAAIGLRNRFERKRSGT